MTMNGWFARSLGSTAAAGLLFLAIGMVSDLFALVIPLVPPPFGERATEQLPWPDGRPG
jgi:hypothetical protein